MKKLAVLAVLMMLVSLGTAHAASNPGTTGGTPSETLTLPIFSPDPSCKSDIGVGELPAQFYYYGYCYYDCSPCWSGNHGFDCPVVHQCTELPLC